MKILFVCSGNTCRSPLAEGLFNKIAQESKLDVVCDSAGLAAFSGMPASENSVLAAQEIGVDISEHKSKPISSVDISSYDLIVPMTVSHANLLLNLGADKGKIYLPDEDVPDPYGGDIGVYRHTRDTLSVLLNKLAKRIKP